MEHFSPFSAILGGALIGFAATLLMAATGRIAGVSGFASRLLPPYEDGDWLPRLAFVAGLVTAPRLYQAATGAPIEVTVMAGTASIIGAGFLVGFGAVLGNGCTSGHGVCGIARLSRRSLVATGTFMVSALLTVFISYHYFGGAL